MSRLFRFVAILLLAVWLPVTKHCMLEAAGLLDIASQEADSGCCVDTEPCIGDGCVVVEQTLTKSSNTTPKVPAAQLLAIADFLCVVPSADREQKESSSRLSGPLDMPLDWVPAWHFEHRTAPPSRAPSLLSA